MNKVQGWSGVIVHYLRNIISFSFPSQSREQKLEFLHAFKEFSTKYGCMKKISKVRISVHRTFYLSHDGIKKLHS